MTVPNYRHLLLPDRELHSTGMVGEPCVKAQYAAPTARACEGKQSEGGGGGEGGGRVVGLLNAISMLQVCGKFDR